VSGKAQKVSPNPKKFKIHARMHRNTPSPNQRKAIPKASATSRTGSLEIAVAQSFMSSKTSTAPAQPVYGHLPLDRLGS